ncbi:MAG: NAD(P)/FAD-dependent oxidoreductase [Bacteroidota bacterium]
MTAQSTDVLILGGGLSGLLTAHLLRQQGITALILEARHRIGGRIQTTYFREDAPLEMGATWLGKKHQQLVALLQELDIGIFEQRLGKNAIYEPISTSPPQLVQLPPNDAPSFRIQGGTHKLIQSLADSLESHQIQLGQEVQSIELQSDGLLVKSQDKRYHAQIVVSTLPPYLLLQTVQLQPSLPEEVQSLALNTHTWMGESIKVGLTYAAPYWRAPNLSGNVFSNVGPISELYDHSNVEESFFALKGFMNASYHSTSREFRLERILQQLEKYFGRQVREYLQYEEVVWRQEPHTFRPYQTDILPHQNNGHPLFRHLYLDNRLILAGSETAAQFPGYMEGAVQSALRASQQISTYLQNLV